MKIFLSYNLIIFLKILKSLLKIIDVLLKNKVNHNTKLIAKVELARLVQNILENIQSTDFN